MLDGHQPIHTPLRWLARDFVIVDDVRPRVMGVLNVTPDSFSDGGLSASFPHALTRARELVAQGADLLDIGGESTRPGSEPVSVDEELRRVLPVVEALRELVSVPLSVDTSKPEVARRCLAAGASLINDITALADRAMAEAVAESNAGVVLMHMRGTPRTMQHDPSYDEVVIEVHDALARSLDRANAWGISRDRIAVDPGIGFGKTLKQNLLLLRNLERFASLGCAVVVGTSRKSFLGALTGRPVLERQTASVVSALAAILGGAHVVRVHDVGPMVDALKVWEAQHGWARS